MRLTQDLESVADSPDQAAIGCEVDHRLHQRSEPRHRAGAQVVAIRETSRKNHAVRTPQARVLVPEHHRLVTGQLDGMRAVAIRPRPGKDRNAKSHWGPAGSTARPMLTIR